MVKVTICGSTSEKVEPLSVELKRSNTINHLALYDIANVRGLVADRRQLYMCKIDSFDSSTL